MAGAPLGNRNGAKAKDWETALRKSLVQGDPEALRKIADKLIAKALEGDMAAIKEIGDRLDGKPKQSVDVGGPDGGPLTVAVLDSSKLSDATIAELMNVRTAATD